jgi:hypothetical protein
MTISYPSPFLFPRVETHTTNPPLVGLCAGYEGGKWRCSQLADHLFNWLPYAALDQEHQHSFQAANFVELLKNAAAHIYKTHKTESRGEIGELLFHIVSILHFKTIPVICKLTLKTTANDTVKGFDGIHVILKNDGDFELWLGESKFYTNPNQAIKHAIASVRDHILPDFLSTEKAMVYGHIGKDIPQREEIVKIFKPLTSSDELISKSVFPILIAYDSQTVADFNQ